MTAAGPAGIPAVAGAPASVPARRPQDWWQTSLARWSAAALGFGAFGALIGLHDSSVGRSTLQAIGLAETGALAGRLVMALLFAVAGTINTYAVLQIRSLTLQILVVWAELLILFLAFFYSFNLSFPYIAERLEILIATGAFTTVYISLISIVISCVIALAGALARLSSNGIAFGIATFYISFFRGTPLLLQVFLIYLGLPQLGLVLDAVPSGIIALSLCYGAYMAEIFRAGIQGVPKGQWEAAQSLGLTHNQTLKLVILPQAMRLIVPPTGNQFIAMLKDSSLVSIMGVQELMFLARTQGRAEFKHFEMLITAAIIYWIISISFELVQTRIERKFGKGVAAI